MVTHTHHTHTSPVNVTTLAQVANDFVQVINRLGENIEARLDAKLDVTRAHGSLKMTVDTIHAVLSKYEANQ